MVIPICSRTVTFQKSPATVGAASQEPAAFGGKWCIYGTPSLARFDLHWGKERCRLLSGSFFFL